MASELRLSQDLMKKIGASVCFDTLNFHAFPKFKVLIPSLIIWMCQNAITLLRFSEFHEHEKEGEEKRSGTKRLIFHLSHYII